MSRARVSAAVLVLGVVTFAVLAAWWVPWHPYPGGPLDPPSAQGVFASEHLREVEAYTSGARLIGRASLVISLLVAAALGFTSLGRRLTARLRGPWPLQVGAAVVLVLLLGRLATLPFAVLTQRRRLEADLSVQSWGSWVGDVLLNLGLEIVVGTIALVVLFFCIRRWSRAWPAVAGGLLGALVLLGSFVYPVLVQPLFNDFRPLPSGDLRAAVMQLAEAEDVEIDQVLVADASRRTTALNAYVSGIGGTRRVVLYDTLVEDVDRPEALAVIAHELAHAKYRDVLTGTLLGTAGALAAAGALGLLAGRRRDLGRPASVPYVLALYAVAAVLVLGVQNTISRQIETRADVAALRATGDRDGFIAVQRALATRSLADPEPAAWSQFWFGSHPTVLQRIALAYRILG